MHQSKGLMIIDMSLSWLLNEHQQTEGVLSMLELICHIELICLMFVTQ